MYKNQTKEFLQKKGIKSLYVSIDNKANKDRWKGFVTNKQLYGNHYLASEKLLEQIQKALYKSKVVTIPRYLLFDKNGNILSDNLPRPSGTEALKKEISNLLLKGNIDM
ncbi:thioredoxin family protein [Chitinophagaceae bacterium LB-8]|uniref:Thioredoxin family protein n=1 Tax=Paraflavisolibacter caeni TaxID=2982496 RepID=A0A9X3BFM8_9BACT|nr:hypothetical protein [Paraflavisolibacter caeni]MCU7549234.1 thioredoxin family protein [Paraflavisolibacter caeni]